MAAAGLTKSYSANTSSDEVITHNGKAGVILVGFAAGVSGGTVTLKHTVGDVDVTIDSLSASGGTQFVSPLGKLKLQVSGYAGSGNIDVIVKPLNEH